MRAPSSRCRACSGVWSRSVLAELWDMAGFPERSGVHWGQASGQRVNTVHPCAAPLSALPERFARTMPHLLLRWTASGGGLSPVGDTACESGGCQSFCLSVQDLPATCGPVSCAFGGALCGHALLTGGVYLRPRPPQGWGGAKTARSGAPPPPPPAGSA